MSRPLPADLAALVRAGVLEEVQPGVYRRRPRLPARDELHGEQQHTPDRREHARAQRTATPPTSITPRRPDGTVLNPPAPPPGT